MRRTTPSREVRAEQPWWQDAVFYQVYLRSFADSDGDGVGDLEGLRARLGYLELLGVDALWITPCHRSPIADPGYDEADPREAEPLLGDLAEFDRLVAEAAGHGIRFWADEPQLGVNPELVAAAFDADGLHRAIERSMAAVAGTGAPPTWTLANHDVARQVTRYGGDTAGLARARAMALVELALPGVIFLYNGEELGLPDVDVPDWALLDPKWIDSGRTTRPRDNGRVPLPWEGAEPPFGFTKGERPWLPMPRDWAGLTVEAQLEDPDSTLSLYRQAIELRATHQAFTGETLEWYGAPAGCFAYRRKGGGLICVLNTTSASIPLPAGELLLASTRLRDGRLPADSAAWLV